MNLTQSSNLYKGGSDPGNQNSTFNNADITKNDQVSQMMNLQEIDTVDQQVHSIIQRKLNT